MAEQIIEARENRRWLGLIGLISSLVTLISFFFLPWFRVFGNCSSISSPAAEAFCSSLLKGPFEEATGLAVANGGYSYTYVGSPLVFSFPLLWALVLVSVILLVLSILVALSKVVAKKGARAIQIICGVALVVALAIEVIYMGSAYAAPSIAGAAVRITAFDASGHVIDFQGTSPSFGFWLALLATLGGMVFWIVTLYNISDSGVLPYGPTAAASPSGALPYKPVTDYGSPPYGVPLQNPYEQLIPPPPPLQALRARSVGRTILSVFFYLWGIFWLSLGLAEGVLYYAPSSIVRLGVVASCIVGLVILILLLLFRKRLYLGTRRRLWLEIGLLLIGVLLTFTVFAAVPSSSPTAQNIALGSVFVIYGLIAAFVAYW